MSTNPDLQYVNGSLEYVGEKRQVKLDHDTLVVREGESPEDVAARKLTESFEIEREKVTERR